MRIPSGSTNRTMSFVPMTTDRTDRVNVATTNMTVRRSRNGSAFATYTTPTLTNHTTEGATGVYSLLIDEDTTLTAGRDEEEYTVHISASGMRPVTRTIEIYRPKFTEGQAATMASNRVASNLEAIAGSTAGAANLKTATTNYTAATGLAGTRLDATVSSRMATFTLPTNWSASSITTAGEYVLSAASRAAIVDDVWREQTTDHSGVSGSMAASLAAAGAAGDPWQTSLPGSYTTGQAGNILGNRLDAAITSRLAATAAPTNWSASSITTAGEYVLSSASRAALVDDVWREQTTDHSGVAGSMAAALNAAGSAGDPWQTALPGSYTTGQAGNIVGNRLDALISSRMATFTLPTNFAATAITTAGVVSANTIQFSGSSADVALLNTHITTDGVVSANSPTASVIADSVWNSSYLFAWNGGSFGRLLANLHPTTEAADIVRIDQVTTGYLGTLESRLVTKYRLDHLFQAAITLSTADVADNSFAARLLVSATGGAVSGYDQATDSQQAIRDRIDAAALHQAVADEVLKRNVSNVESTAGMHSMAGIVLMQTEGTQTTGGTFRVNRTDGSTLFANLTATLSTDTRAVTAMTV